MTTFDDDGDNKWYVQYLNAIFSKKQSHTSVTGTDLVRAIQTQWGSKYLAHIRVVDRQLVLEIVHSPERIPPTASLHTPCKDVGYDQYMNDVATLLTLFGVGEIAMTAIKRNMRPRPHPNRAIRIGLQVWLTNDRLCEWFM